jgi:hypothetical protein
LLLPDADTSGSESGDLTPGFISDNDDCVANADVNSAELAIIAEMLPVTAKRVSEVHSKRRCL